MRANIILKGELALPVAPPGPGAWSPPGPGAWSPPGPGVWSPPGPGAWSPLVVGKGVVIQMLTSVVDL